MLKIQTPSRMMTVHSGERLMRLPQVERLPTSLRRDIHVVSRVLPFKVNDYVVDELIDWSRVPDDPIYRLTFPHRDMLRKQDFDAIARLVDRDGQGARMRFAADEIRRRLNPHPGDQLQKNVPSLHGQRLNGIQHKYRETVLFFPAQGQTCHAYCAYCFRWAQFVGMNDLRQMNRDVQIFAEYLRVHPAVTDVLITGGDPMVMSSTNFAKCLEPILADDLNHVRNIRIGTKALSYWPYRFLTDPDADELLRLIERCVKKGRQVAIMAHVTHPRELETAAALSAIRRLQRAGAILRTQSPVVRHVNDDAPTWIEMWGKQVQLGMVPYYMFVERDTGARRYFEIPLIDTLRIFQTAFTQLSGLARTVRGPSMSTTPGKVVVDGVTEIHGKPVFCLRFLQARNPDWVGRPFFARFDPEATWLNDLRPASGERHFFFEHDPIQSWRDLDPAPHASGNGNQHRDHVEWA